MKLLIFFSTVLFLSFVFLFSPGVVSAEGDCELNYEDFGLKCQPIADCGDSAEITAQTQKHHSDVGQGSLVVQSGKTVITGQCADANQVCCFKTGSATSGSAAGTSFEKPTSGNTDSFVPTKPDKYLGPLPPCAWAGTCRGINDVLSVAVKWGSRIFGFIGSMAFVMFVYGGFMMMISMGNAERVKKGTDIMVAAVVGLIIAFSAYLIVGFILDAIGVTDPQFRAVDKISAVFDLVGDRFL